MTTENVNDKAQEKEPTLKDVYRKLVKTAAYLKLKWPVIVIAGILGAIVGISVAILKKPVYTATSTFVLEENGKGGAFSQYSGLASLAGIDLGRDGGGIFQGDNILELYKSRLMIEKTLLSPVTINGKQQLLIDRYIDAYKLRSQWQENSNTRSVTFNGDPSKFNRTQDSIISDLTDQFNKKMLIVTKPDKKLSIIKVDVIAKDEVFAQEFNNKLVETVNNFYTLTKTKKSAQNIAVLQRQADSVKRVLGYSISGVASAIDAAPNANPAMVSLRVPSQKKQIDVQASTAIYSEIVKNLELSKISLRQETPLIQVIDQPVLPLAVNKLAKQRSAIIGFLIGSILVACLLILKRMVSGITS